SSAPAVPPAKDRARMEITRSGGTVCEQFDARVPPKMARSARWNDSRWSCQISNRLQRIRKCELAWVATTPACTPPRVIMKKLANSYYVYLALMAFLAFITLSTNYLFVGQFRSVAQAKVFDWQFLAIWTAAGLIGIYFANRTGFPDMLDERISHI